MLMVFSDFYGGTPTSAYNTPTMSMRWDNDGNFADPWLERSVNLHPGWNCIVTGRQIVARGTAVAGSPVWSEGHTSTATSGLASSWVTDTMSQYRTSIAGIGAGLTTITYYTQMVDDVVAESRIILRFDDAYESVYTIAFPLMQARGLVGVLGVISSYIGQVGYMNAAQIQELANAGWEIANHSHQHLNNNYTESESYWVTEIQTCSAAIHALTGKYPTTYISPYGDYLRGTASGYRSAVQLLFDVSLGTTDANLGPILLQGHYLPCQSMYTHGGVGTIEGHISRLQAVIGSGCSVICMFHNFTAGATTSLNDLTTADLTAFLNVVSVNCIAGTAENVTVEQLVDELEIGFQLAS